jgi:hypothetical protein
MKKLMLLAGLYCLQPALFASSSVNPGLSYIAPVDAYVAPINATDRAKAHFYANYAGARDASWYNLPNKNMYCIFHHGKVVSRVFYDSRGFWLYTLMGYPASNLSQEIKDQVANDYDGYRIVWVNEIQSNQSKPVYMINIENENHIRVIKIAGDEIDEQLAFNKE